jgi:DNA-binding winged helix-turn-helix (wHTH) protein
MLLVIRMNTSVYNRAMKGGNLIFGRCTLDPRTRTLVRDGSPVELQQQPLSLLMLLVEHADAVVTRETIRERIWPDAVVEYDQGINYAIRRIRVALGGDADRVQTVAGRGYRFVGPVDTDVTRPRPSAPLVAGFAAASGLIFAAGIVAAHTDAGAFIYEHIVHPDHCPYVRMVIAIHKNS